MVGEGLARAITIGSIVLTVGALTVALSFARRRSRIRVGFDVARAVVAVAGVLVAALLAHTGAPVVAVVAAVAAGLGLGFAQGRALEVGPGKRGFYARRSPIALALWGVGMVVIQVAGIAARTGAVQVGQGIAWFSACLVIGLIVGRNRPLQRARQAGAEGGATLLVLVLAVLLPVALVGGAFTTPSAAADGGEITTDDICALLPTGPGWEQRPETLWCSAHLRYDPDGVRSADDYEIILSASYNPAADHAALGPFSEQFADDPSVTGFPEGIGDDAYEREDPWRLDVRFYRGPVWAEAAVYGNLAAAPGARDLARDIDARAIQLLAEHGVAVPGTSTSGPPADTGSTLTTTSTTGASTTLPPSVDGEPSDDAGALTPQEAVAQAIAGLIAAAAMGVITWVEAAAGISEVLAGADVEPPPPEPPPSEEPRPAERPADPCAFQQARYEEALGEWRRIQTEIDALRSEYRALQVQIEADRARDMSGALFDLGAMGYDLLGAQPPTPGVFKAMVEAAKQEFGRAVVKQLIQAAAAGERPDPATILYEAAHGAAGARDLATGKAPGGAFGEFFTQSITALLAANRSYDYLKFMDTLAAPGAIADPEVMRALEQSSFEMYFERVGPWVGVVAKSIDLWYKNKEWGEGVERRNGRRAELTRLGTRIGELEYDLGYATEARDSYLGFLSRCREETP